MSVPASTPLRVAVIGAGGIARLRHIPSFIEGKQRGWTDVVAVCDPIEESARAVQAEFGIPDVALDYRQVVSRPDIDIVSVATPNAYHEEISIAALRAGKHVLCEKPIATSLAGARRMAEVAAASGRRTSVNFRYRWVPAALFLKDLVAGGELGEIYHIFMNYLNGGLADPNRPIRWRQTKAESGSGNLGDLGSHMIDMAHWLVGPMSRVCANLTTFTPERPLVGGGRARVDVDDAASMLVDFASGARGTITASGCAIARGNYQRVELHGTKGSAIYEIESRDASGDRLLVCLGAAQARHRGYATIPVPAEHARVTASQPFFDLVQAIREDREAPVTFVDGLRAQEVIEAAEISDRESRWVSLPLP
jgi:predicted dehydrogenase